MQPMQVARLERRVLHLERKLVVWASRMKKEVIWRKFLEDWIQQRFNFDLRLQVELKTLEEDGVDEFEKEEKVTSGESETYSSTSSSSPSTMNVQGSLQNFPGSRKVVNQRISRGRPVQVSTRGTSMSTPGMSGGLGDNADLSGGCSQNPSILSRNVSITVVSNSSTNSGGNLGNYGSPQGQHRMTTSRSSVVGNSPQRVVGPSAKRQQLHNSPEKRVKRNIKNSSHPIIVSTSSIASGSSSQLYQHDNLSPSTSSTTTGNNASNLNKQQPEVILLDDEDDGGGPSQLNLTQNMNSNSVSSSSAQSQIFAENSITNQPSQNQTVHLPIQVQSVQQMQQLPVTSSNSIISREEHYPDSNIQNTEFNRNAIYDESSYVAGGYLTRYGEQKDKIAFDIKKILQHQDPFITDNILLEILSSQTMSVQAKKNITSALGDFLMTVYGDSPPRVAKECMAESLLQFFPFIPKETWWYKLPFKNPSGCLENRIHNKRRHIVDERRRQQMSTANGEMMISNNQSQGSLSQQPLDPQGNFSCNQ